MDLQSCRAAGRIVDGGAGGRDEDAGHERSNLRWGEELAGALALPFGKLAEQVLVGPTKDVGIDIVRTESMLAEDLNQLMQPLVVEDALALVRPGISCLDLGQPYTTDQPGVKASRPVETDG